MNNETFTLEELLAALQAARTSQDVSTSAATVAEIRAVTGHSPHLIAQAIRAAMKAGRVECVRKPMVRIDGVRTTVPAYRVVRHD